MHSSNHMHRASAPGSGRLDLSLAGRRASRRTRSQRVAVVVAQVAPALLRSSSMEVLERPSAQDPAESGHECHNRGTATMSRSSAHTHTRCWHALRACGGDNQTNQGTTPEQRARPPKCSWRCCRRRRSLTSHCHLARPAAAPFFTTDGTRSSRTPTRLPGSGSCGTSGCRPCGTIARRSRMHSC